LPALRFWSNLIFNWSIMFSCSRVRRLHFSNFGNRKSRRSVIPYREGRIAGVYLVTAPRFLDEGKINCVRRWKGSVNVLLLLWSSTVSHGILGVLAEYSQI
jgi:hypothetical protein